LLLLLLLFLELLGEIMTINIIFPKPPPFPTHYVIDFRFKLLICVIIDQIWLCYHARFLQNRPYYLSLLQWIRDKFKNLEKCLGLKILNRPFIKLLISQRCYKTLTLIIFLNHLIIFCQNLFFLLQFLPLQNRLIS
jgi:hypothetical protein